MEFTKSLIKGKLVKRYKRFFADIKVNKEIITAHCPNTGSMMGLLDQNNDVWISKNDDPKRKLKYTLEIIKAKNNLVGVNTHLANKIVAEGLKNSSFKEFNNHTTTELAVHNDQKLVLEDQYLTVRGYKNEYIDHDFDNIVRGDFYTKIGNLKEEYFNDWYETCLLYTSPSPRDATLSRMPSSA